MKRIAIDWEGEINCALEEIHKLKQENEKLKEKMRRFEEKESCEAPKSALDKLERIKMHA